MKSAKKSVIAGEYILSVLNNGSIEVCRSSDNVKLDNVKEALRQIAKQEGFEYDPNWNTRQFGNKLLNFLNGNGINATKADKVELDYKYASHPVFDFKFKKVDWELNEENLEKHRDSDSGEYIDFFGVVMVRATSEAGDFETKVFADCDIVDSLYDAMEAKDEYLDDGWDSVEVYYTTICEAYGAGESYERGQEFGYVLASVLGCDYNGYSYDMDGAVICRAAWDNSTQIWIADDWGDYSEDINLDIDTLIEYKKDPASVDGKIEWVGMPKMQCLNTNNEPVFEFAANKLGDCTNPNGLICIELDGKYGYITPQGEEVIPCQYVSVGSYSNGLIAVQLEDKWGYINEKGEEVIPCKFDGAYDFSSNGLAKVEIDGKYGYINNKGELVVPCQYDYHSAHIFSSNGLTLVESDEKYGYVNEKGEEVIPCQYDYAEDFCSNGLAQVEMDEKYGYINEKGEEVIPCKFDSADDFSSNGLAKVEIDGKYGYVNEKGELVIPCQYDSANDFCSNGLALVKIDEKYGYINQKGEVVVPCQYDYALDFASNGLARVEMDEKYGFVNEKGELVIPCQYDYAEDFCSNGLAQVEMDEKYGCINEKGEVVIPIEYSDLTLFDEELIFVKK